MTATKDKLYHTVSARWRNTNWDVIGTVQNVFDKDPPGVGDGVPRNATGRIFNTPSRRRLSAVRPGVRGAGRTAVLTCGSDA